MPSAPDHVEDLALVRAVLAGEGLATAKLVERLRFVPCALRSLNRRLGQPLGPEDIDDVTQDTLALLWPRLEAYTGQAALESWIYGFCANGLMNAVRKRRRRQPSEVSTESLAGMLGSEDGSVEQESERERLRGALEALPADEARLIRLRYYDELTFEEIGRRLALAPSTAKAAVYRGMKRLESLLRRGSEQDLR